MKTNKTSKILNNVVLIGIILTLLLLLGTPLGLTAFFKSSELSRTNLNLPNIFTVAVYICAIPYVTALFLLKKLCKLVANKDPFSHKVPMILKKIAICAFSEVILFNGVNIALGCFYGIYFYAVTVMSCTIVTFVSIAIGFMALVSSKLFEMAIEIKDENDKTI